MGDEVHRGTRKEEGCGTKYKGDTKGRRMGTGIGEKGIPKGRRMGEGWAEGERGHRKKKWIEAGGGNDKRDM